VNPFELCVAIVENAVDNGVTLKLNEEVTKITKKKDYYIVKTKDNTYEAKVVVNAAGLYSDEIAKMVNLNSFKIRPRKGEYIVLDHFEEPYVSHVLFPMPSNKGKGIMMAPTTHNNYLVGASSDFIDDKGDYSTHKETIDEIISSVNKMVSHLPLKRNIRQFSGLRSTGNTGDFIIEEKDGFIILGAIESPGLAAAPSIALEAVELVSKTLDLNEKENYNPKRRKVNRLSKMGMEERNKLIKENPSYGRIICRCEQISEGEVIDSIRRNAGATTVKGVKKRCRPGFGLCQGGFCEPRVIEILARELNKDMLDIRYDGLKSYILKTYSKESGDAND
jgi:glycerol-3-phosphate dehydrogenase